MLSSLILAAAFQVGPFYQQKQDYVAVRPFVAVEGEAVDVLWPVFTSHRDWWRFCLLVNYQEEFVSDGEERDGDYQFFIVPLWFNGRATNATLDPEPSTLNSQRESYWGLFPLWGHHPHLLMMHDLDFALWPLWTHYKMPRGRDWLETNTILFPFISWRSDGAWSIWPIYGLNHQRESDHQYVLWPIVTWAQYREDRDTAGEGWSWMVWPLYGQVYRKREHQEMFIPPFFSYAHTFGRRESTRIRCPWPFFEYETSPKRWRMSVWPLWERDVQLDFRKSEQSSTVTRFGWKLVELYDDETRVFPFWASGRDHMRIWPFWESEERKDGFTDSRVLALVPIRWVPAVDRSWAKFWTFYESRSCPLYTDHSLFWGIIRWRTYEGL